MSRKVWGHFERYIQNNNHNIIQTMENNPVIGQISPGEIQGIKTLYDLMKHKDFLYFDYIGGWQRISIK